MKQFRIFTNDMGPNAYSCLQSQSGHNAVQALETFLKSPSRRLKGWKALAVADTPEALSAFGPNGATGKLPRFSVLAEGRRKGEFAGPEVVR